MNLKERLERQLREQNALKREIEKYKKEIENKQWALQTAEYELKMTEEIIAKIKKEMKKETL